MTREGNKLTIDVDDPFVEDSGLRRVLVTTGGQIQCVNEFNPTLEGNNLRILQETR